MPTTGGRRYARHAGHPGNTPAGSSATAAEAAPTGYRATNTTRRQLEMARQFTGHGSLQTVIDAAVKAYLAALAATSPEYRTALEALDPKLLADIGH